MVMSWIWTGILLISLTFSIMNGNISAVSGAVLSGAQGGITLALSMAGTICLWSGVAEVMQGAGLTKMLSRLLSPLTGRIFPGTKKDTILAQDLSANICANFLGLGNAATPLGIRAVKRMTNPTNPAVATNEMCRLIVLNTASIQLIPATVAGVRASLGCTTPFDILPAVWITSLCSAGLGLMAAYLLGKVWRHD
ncbi:MAG: spore maturation protein A [Oscillospiraceae bacterium]|nr:spore maturation protein A [Oscillospiraceae bacterium]